MTEEGYKGGLVSRVQNKHSGKRYTVSTAQEIGKDYWTTGVLKIKLLFFADFFHPLFTIVRNNKEDAHKVHWAVKELVIDTPENEWLELAPQPAPIEGYSKDAQEIFKKKNVNYINGSKTEKKEVLSLLKAITRISDLSYEPLITKYPFFKDCFKKYDNPRVELTLWMTAAGAGYALLTKEGYRGEHDEIIKSTWEMSGLSKLVEDFTGIMLKVKDNKEQIAIALPVWVLSRLKGENPTMEEINGPGVDIAKILDLTIRDYETEQAKKIKEKTAS